MKLHAADYLSIGIAIALAVVRILGNKTEFFQAIAHLVVGGCLGFYSADRSRTLYLRLAIFLSLVELLCFLGLIRVAG